MELSAQQITRRRVKLGGERILKAEQEQLQAKIDKELARVREKERKAAAKRRELCGAKTRKGTPCKALSEPGKRRCKLHGGKSTGAKTAEGRARIVEAQKRRWAKAKEDELRSAKEPSRNLPGK